MPLQAIAISAPEYPFGRLGTKSLDSRDPVSLFNACRYAAFLAENRLGVWGDSNWAVPRKDRKRNLLLMNSLTEEICLFEELLARERPSLLLIGSMTVCLPGAIECAKLAKQMFGNEILVVLGGRHANETVYTDRNRLRVKHHNSSPLRLIAEQKIPNVFDLVVSGEGEFIISKIGEITSRPQISKDASLLLTLNEEATGVPGNWIAGCVDDGKIQTVISRGIPFDRDRLPSPAKMFGVNTEFSVFGGSLTGHAFSDIGAGCIYNCDFCSERHDVCGSLIQTETSANRLFRQLMDICEVVNMDSPGRKASAFIEDSIILGGLTSPLIELGRLMKDHPIDIKFGGQLTIDIAIKQRSVIKELISTGLSYMFVGLETLNPVSIGGMSKDTSSGSWIDRAQRMVSEYTKMGLKVGVAILFGLGEDQQQRLSLLERVSSWRKNCGNPVVVSYNWVVQHPLKGNDKGAGYNYLEWAVNTPEYIEAFRDYGEASVIYTIPRVRPPSLEELLELQQARKELSI